MINMLTYSSSEAEIREIGRIAKDKAALYSDERWVIYPCNSIDKMKDLLEDGDPFHVICFDITVNKGIHMIEELRRRFKEAYIILIASDKISPVLYMKPTIMAAALLLRPLKKGQTEEAMNTLVHSVCTEENNDVMVLEGGEEKFRVAYRDILYLEARNKKIYVCTAAKEYGFYDTLDQLEATLPSGFIRCHRGFIVNSAKIRKVALSEGWIYLEEGCQVPVSRSYRQVIKEYR